MDLERLRRALRGHVAGDLRLDSATRELYAADASLYRCRPVGALRARTPDDLGVALAACRESGVPLTMRGAGTSLAGQAVGPGLVVDCSALNAIAVEPDRRIARVGPGAVLDDVNAAAGAHDLLFGPDVATGNRATIGGMIANNSAGSRSVIYGQTGESVVGLDVFLATGDRVTLRRGGAVPAALDGSRQLADAMPARTLLRRVSGYALDAMAGPNPDWPGVICGSEGTLGVIAAAELALEERPAFRALAVLRYPSMAEALDCVVGLLESGPSAIELLDLAMLDADGHTTEAGDRAVALLVEHSGDQEDVRRRLAELPAAQLILDPAHQEHIWAGRRAGIAWALKQASRGAGGEDPRPIPFIEDPAVPPDRLGSFSSEVRRVLDEEGVRAIWYGHASVGCLHIRPVMDLRKPAEVVRVRRIAESVAQLVAKHDGSLSGEHGDGRVRSELLPAIYPPETIAAFAQLKRRLDPDGILNPGVIVDPHRLDEDLRAVAPVLPAPAPRLSFVAAGGIGRAARACNGNGLCRAHAGAMCPTYQALGDERHSTRGRAVLFRAAIEGRLEAGLADPGLHEALELCLGCKACARECPAEVDMAWMKIEALAARHARRHVPLSTWLAAHAHEVLALGGHLVPIARMGARVVSHITGRALPSPVARWRPPRRSGRGSPLVLMADTFTRYLHPEVGDAARAVLASNARVEVVSPGCCGRPLLSMGLVDRARHRAVRMLDRLAPHALAGTPIVVLEPSCWSMLVDDVPRLLPDDPRAAWVAERARSFERAAGELGLRASERAGTVLHPHCHARALGEADAIAAIVPGGRDSGAGCCGMAGAFGYQHPAVSREVAETLLGPATRDAERVIASGTSCRQQIVDLTGRRALHPAEALAADLMLDDRTGPA
ncbi:MAG: FAD-binding oxidoreductase [Thermoleophilia bacterium]|nr:FAD-binding oxidoreductase [Thermoleophilia bacterium]